MYVDRTYRNELAEELETFEVKIKETDLLISVEKGSLSDQIKNEIFQYTFQLRNELENYISLDPLFRTTLEPHVIHAQAPMIAREMVKCGNAAGVGPMAAVAGAFAQSVGQFTMNFSREVIVENGGDIFIQSSKERTIGIFAGTSPFSNKIGLKIAASKMPLGICTSSGTVGPSLSFGKADAVVILSPSAFLADAIATAAGNLVQTEDDLNTALELAEKQPGIKGAVIIKGIKMAAWGDFELIPINR